MSVDSPTLARPEIFFGMPPYETVVLDGTHTPDRAVDLLTELPPLVPFEGPLPEVTLDQGRVLSRISFGVKTPVIARQLHVSPRTVARHKESLFAAMGANNLTHAVRLGFHHGILQVRPHEFEGQSPPVLTNMELLELELAARGLSCDQAADFRGVSGETSATHRSKIMGQLGVISMPHAVRRAYSAGMLSESIQPLLPALRRGRIRGGIRRPAVVTG